MSKTKLVPLKGSHREPIAGATVLAPCRPDERFEVIIKLRRKKALPPRLVATGEPHLTLDELEADHGSSEKDVRAVTAFARESALTVVDACAARRSVTLSGTAEDFSLAFGVKLQLWEHPDGTYRGRKGSVKIPAHLVGIILGVFGLDNRPFARPRFSRAKPAAAGAAFNGYLPNEVAKLYNFPTDVDGTGEVIGIIELGGGYRPADLKIYAQKMGRPAPTVIPVSVDGGKNNPSTPDSADGEVMLDIEVASGVAPGAKIVVYFAKDASEAGFLSVLSHSIHDAVNKPSIISISWGGPEASATDTLQTQFDETLQSAAALGITVTIASGDNGAADESPSEWDNQVHADFPASSPHALACGATNIQIADGAVIKESAWNQGGSDGDSFGSTGGGISETFPVPAYQIGLTMPKSLATKKSGRGVPDVSGNGDPASGFLVRADGQEFAVGGTSAVAPLWAGLLALINQKLKSRVGFLNPQLYKNPTGLVDVTIGSNKVGKNLLGYDAGAGWDACTGLGRPDGEKLLAMLSPMPSGQPHTILRRVRKIRLRRRTAKAS